MLRYSKHRRGSLNSAEIKFTLLDVHPRSLDAARSIFQAHGKSAFVRDYIQYDAASYKSRGVIHVMARCTGDRL
jgi:hypothetical protein